MGRYANQLANFLASNKNNNVNSLKLATFDGTCLVCGELKLDADDVLINSNISSFVVGGIYVIYSYSDEIYLVLERVVEVNEFITR